MNPKFIADCMRFIDVGIIVALPVLFFFDFLLFNEIIILLLILMHGYNILAQSVNRAMIGAVLERAMPLSSVLDNNGKNAKVRKININPEDKDFSMEDLMKDIQETIEKDIEKEKKDNDDS